jgi:hypothetical protein
MVELGSRSSSRLSSPEVAEKLFTSNDDEGIKGETRVVTE